MKKIFLATITLTCLLSPKVAMAWGPITHYYITESALGSTRESNSKAAFSSVVPDMIAAYALRERLSGRCGSTFDYIHEPQPPDLDGRPVFGDRMRKFTSAKFTSENDLAIGWMSHQIADTSAHDIAAGFVANQRIFADQPLLDHGLSELAVDALLFSEQSFCIEALKSSFDARVIHEASMSFANEEYEQFPYSDQEMLNCPRARALYAFWMKCIKTHVLFIDFLKHRKPTAFRMLCDHGRLALKSEDPVALPQTIVKVRQFIAVDDPGNAALLQKLKAIFDLRANASEDSHLMTSAYDRFLVDLTCRLQTIDSITTGEGNDVYSDLESALTESYKDADENDDWSRFIDLLVSDNAEVDDLKRLAVVACDHKAPQTTERSLLLWMSDQQPEIRIGIVDEESGIDANRINVLIDDRQTAICYEDGFLNIKPTYALVDGRHQLMIEVSDLAGNIARFDFLIFVDTIAPQITSIDIGWVAGTNPSGCRVDMVADEPVTWNWLIKGNGARRDIYECGNSDLLTCRQQIFIPQLQAPRFGTYMISVQITDKAGNIGDFTDRIVWSNAKTRK